MKTTMIILGTLLIIGVLASFAIVAADVHRPDAVSW